MMTRRKFLSYSLLSTAGAMGAYGTLVEPRLLDTTHHRLDGPALQQPVTIVQISDLHLNHLTGLYEDLAATVNAINPTYILITGDSVDERDTLPLLDGFLSLLSPGIPKYAIVGNWEHWCGVNIRQLSTSYERANGRLLVNESVVIAGGSILLTGLDDLVGGLPDIPGALDGVPEAPYHLLLEHCPEFRDHLPEIGEWQARRDSARYMMAGHSHGGQVNIFGWTAFLPQGTGRYVRGWFTDGPTALYVSRGIGTTRLPIRIGSRPEVTVFTLGA